MDGLGENVATGVVEEREKQPFMSIDESYFFFYDFLKNMI